MRIKATGTGFDGFQADAGQGDIIDLVDIIPESADPLSLEPQGAPSLNLAKDDPLVLTDLADPLPENAGALHLEGAEQPGMMPDLAESEPMPEKPVDLLHLADPLPEEELLAPRTGSPDTGVLRIDGEPLPQAEPLQTASPQAASLLAPLPQEPAGQPAETPEEALQQSAGIVMPAAQKAQPVVQADPRIDALEERLTLLEVRMEARLNAFATSLDSALAEMRAELSEMKKRQDALYSEEGAQDLFLRMQPDVERAAARSAAQALREELSQLLELHKAAPMKPF